VIFVPLAEGSDVEDRAADWDPVTTMRSILGMPPPIEQLAPEVFSMILACNSRFIPIAMREVFRWGLYRRLPVGVMIIN
jgi:hypothetical protein